MGWSVPALRAMKEYLVAARKESVAIPHRAQWGKINWNVSDKVPSEQGGLGIRLSTREEVEGDSGQYLTRVVNTADNVVIDVPKVDTVEQLVRDLYRIDATVDVRKARTYEEVRAALINSGYDMVRTANGELYALNGAKIEVASKQVFGEVTEEDMDTGYPLASSTIRANRVEELDTRVPAEVLKETYGNRLPLQWENSDGPVQFVEIMGADKTDNELKVYTEIGIIRFPVKRPDGKVSMNKSVNTIRGKYAVVNGIGQIAYDMDNYSGMRFGSKEGTAEGSVDNDAHGDTAKMIGLMKELNEISGKKDTKEHIKYLEELIGSMDEKFFTAMKTYLDTNAEETRGQVTTEDIVPTPGKDRIDIQISRKQHAGNDQSGAEVYAHEIVHAYTIWALNAVSSEADVVRRKLRHLRDVAMESLKKKHNGEGWRTFMPKDSIDVVLEEKNAKEAWKYVFENDSKNSLAEFTAYMTTNPALVAEGKKINVVEEKVGKSLFERLSEVLTLVMDVLSGKFRWGARNNSVHAEAMELIHQLGRINNNAQVKVNESKSAINRLAEWFDQQDQNLGEKLVKYWDKQTKNMELKYRPMPRNGNKIDMAKWLARYLPLLLMSKNMRPIASGMLKMMGMSSTGIVQNIMRDLWSTDELKQSIHELMRAAGKVDRVREAIAASFRDSIVAGFKVKLTSEQEAALTRVVLDTDMQSIWGEYSKEELVGMLKDEKKLEKAIEEAISQLEKVNPGQANWNVNQATALGYFMATGKGNDALNMNADNIARGTLQFDDRREPMDGEVKAIDKVATLVSLKHSDKYNRRRVAKLVEEEGKGVENLIKHAKLFVEQSKDELFGGNPRLMIKGYSREIFNDTIAIEVAPANSEAEMEAKGYKKVRDLGADPAMGPIEMALYRSSDFNRQEYYRATTKLTGIGRRGTSLTQVALNNYGTSGLHRAKMAKKRADIERKKLVIEMERGRVDAEKVAGRRAPVVDENGNVVDYRYMMDKKGKETVLEQDLSVSKVMGRSMASIYDRVSTEEHNNEVLKLILDDMDVNYNPNSMVGMNGYAYTVIGPKAETKRGREIWKMLPGPMRRSIEKEGRDSIAVREDMIEEYFGFRHWSAADNKIVKYFPHLIRTAIKVLEEMWQSVVAVAKVDILIRMPFVMIGNLVNNMIYGIQTGSSPVQIIKMYVAQMNNIREYTRKHKELQDLEAAERAGNVLKKDLGRMASLRTSLEENPVHELMESGIYESVVEDLNEREAKEKGLLNKYIAEKSKNAPEWAKTGWNWFTLNNQTAWYQNMEIMLRMGDLVGQAVENEKRKVINDKKMGEIKRKMKEEGRSDKYISTKMAEVRREMDRKRLSELSEEFIYYSAPASALEEYANRMGLVMFTKFYKRYQKVLVKSAINRPLRTLLVLGVDHFMFDDGLETPIDQFVIDKMIDGRGLSMFQNPLNLVHLNTPIGLRFAMGTL